MEKFNGRTFICNFCPQTIENEEDGFIIFGSIAITSSRGLKGKFGTVIPTEYNLKDISVERTFVCRKCFIKKLELNNNSNE